LKDHEEKRPDDEALNAAKALLEEDENMNAVHSTKSVVQLLKSAKEKINVVRDSVKPQPKVDTEPKVLNEVSFACMCYSDFIAFSFSRG
jgi:hypothetical protein